MHPIEYPLNTVFTDCMHVFLSLNYPFDLVIVIFNINAIALVYKLRMWFHTFPASSVFVEAFVAS